MDFKEGAVLAINKPLGITSFGALAFVRTRLCRYLGIKKLKVGHAGTLDPLATGVLILCTGKATKQIAELQQGVKEYEAELQFGATTISYDKEYEESEWFSTEHVTREELQAVIPQFLGPIDQVPPTFSACKLDGKRAYELARKEQEVVLEPKKVIIHEIEILDFDEEHKRVKIRVLCGKGTYIRPLARDLGKALNSGAYLTQLCRTRVGEYNIKGALTFEEIRQKYETITV